MSTHWERGFLLLLLLLGVTYLAQQVALWHVDRHPDQWAAYIQQRLQEQVEARFTHLQQKMLHEARVLRDMPEVRALLLHQDSAHVLATAAAWRRYQLNGYRTWEVYNMTPHLLAWKGIWLPPDDAMHDPQFLERIQTGRIRDGDARWGIALWIPVQEHDTLAGGIRVATLLARHVPFQNRYLVPYAIEEVWNTGAYWPFQLRLAESDTTAAGTGFMLKGIDGRPLLQVLPAPFLPEAIHLWAKRRFDDILVLWALLLVIWGGHAGMAYIRHMEPTRAGLLLLALLATTRYALVLLDVPDRWFKHMAWVKPLADPARLASDVGWGVMSSPASLLLTALWIGGAGLGLLLFWQRVKDVSISWRHRLYGVAGIWIAIQAVHRLVQGAVRDSALDFFSLEGLLPEPVLGVVLLSCLLLVVGVLLLGIGIAGRWILPSPHVRMADAGVLALFVLLAFALPGGYGISMAVTGGAIFFLTYVYRRRGEHTLPTSFFTLRLLIPGVLLASMLTYSFLEKQMITRQDEHIQEQLTFFKEGRDVRVLFALEQLREELAAHRELVQAFRMVNADVVGALRLDRHAEALYQRSMLADLSRYEAEIVLLRADGHPVGYFGTSRAPSSEEDLLAYIRLLIDKGHSSIEVRPVTSAGLISHMEYLAVFPVQNEGQVVGWVGVRMRPLQGLIGDVPFPEVFSPGSSRESWYHRLSLALFHQGRLQRLEGAEFGRYRLPPEILRRVHAQGHMRTRERLQNTVYRSYYEVDEHDPDIVYGAHIPELRLFERLFYLFRLTVVGLLMGLLLYLVGIPLRYQRGLLPAPYTRFQDRLLEAFLGVGLIALMVAGTMGIRHVGEESRGAVASWHHRNLQRVEEFLAREAREGESPVEVLERIPVRQLRERLHLDMNVFRGFTLSQTTRPLWFQQRLLSPRLPFSVYKDLFLSGYRQSMQEARIGKFSYLTGYHVLLDATHQPRLAIEVLTLPELERLLEERARTLASFLSALFVLFLLFIATGVVLARTLSRPLARITRGLRALAAGDYPVELPETSRDEVGELARAFNEMQVELEESRQQLAKQQREQAWQEMARQVAHEIKNPLTPMKLSIQHLRQTFRELEKRSGIPTGWEAFRQRFFQVTDVLMQQIDALVRIANAFSQYGNLPRRQLQPVALNEVIRQTVALWQTDYPHITVELDLETTEVWVRGDPEELRRVYINLIKNAIQAMPDGGTLRIATRRKGTEVVSIVEDTGVGIPEELQERIFEPHFSTRTSGTGIGLAITRQIIEAMGGRIQLSSEVGKGTSFYIYFPVDTSALGGESPPSSVTS